MARALENKTNVNPPSADYPYGRIRDNDGSGNGTPVNESVYGDFHQFFERLMDLAGVAHNNAAENKINGFQFIDALITLITKRIYNIWTARSAAEANNWNSVTYGNGLFVAVASDGTNRVMTSPDGITWTARSAAEANGWRSVTYGNGLFVAVANNGTNRVMTSPDGITWTARSATEANNWRSVTYGNGLFVAVASSGTNRVMTSPDGITWTARSAAEANSWTGVTYGNGLFVAVANDGTNRVMTAI
jgi:hypothetical protein